ncbi:MAG: tetratricopeptide repeat protein [Deltaproteobacteria bacterium]|jgi:tetratricopeptide (TPR) repeat protein|nr:tetratricopeptide repeat protein [Deltaproteobacteria bacterium]
MAVLQQLREKNPELSELLLQSQGYGLWICWQGEANPVIAQTLEEYGGMEVVSGPDQALWFFFSIDVFLAGAKLGVWSQFNPLPVSMQIFNAMVQCSHDGTRRILLPEELWPQQCEAPSKFQIYVTADAVSSDPALSNIAMNEAPTPPGFSPRHQWRLAVPDTRPTYKPTHNWICVLHQVITREDKAFLMGWREFYDRLNNILQRSKLRHNVHNNFLMMPLASLRQLKQWFRDYFSLVQRLKNDESGYRYWPCVMAVLPGKGLSLNNDLPNQIALDWNALMPESPYLQLQDAVLLGKEFEISESPLGQGKKTPDALCSVNLAGQNSGDDYILPRLSPASLIFGSHRHCFYCGQHSHATRECPTRGFKEYDLGLWNKVASHDSGAMKEGMMEIEARVQGDPEAADKLMDGTDKASTMTQAIYGICANLQWRSVPMFWRTRGKSYPGALRDLRPEDTSPVWSFLQSMRGRDHDSMLKELETLQIRFPRDFRTLTLAGFVHMEKGDYKKARESWESAHLLSPPGVVQAWHFLLLGRLCEYQNDYVEANRFYDKMLETTPSWLEGHYRKLVCTIKSGFISRAEPQIRTLVAEDPHFFNWLLLDPEIERGSAQVLTILSSLWQSVSLHLNEERSRLNLLAGELANWFTPDHEFFLSSMGRVDKLVELSTVHNYVPYMMVIKGRGVIESDMRARIAYESKAIKLRFQSYVTRLSGIRDEAAWFPFPRALVEFNRNYNAAAASLNWVLKSNIHTADVFKKAQELSETEEERIKKLEKRLKFLRIIRDGTLFALIVIKKFLWIEIIGLAVILAVFPLLAYYGQEWGLSWVSQTFIDERWELQKGAIAVVSMVAISVAGLMTVLRFEKIREKTFEKAREAEAKKAASRAKEMEKLSKMRRARRMANRNSPRPDRPPAAGGS